jgi:ubiquitin-activating enzyme E1 C
MKRFPDVTVTPYPNKKGTVVFVDDEDDDEDNETTYSATSGKIQDYPEDFYRRFDIVVAGLDNVAARRWINAMLVNMVEFHDDGEIDASTIIPLVDGGTEGFSGQARVIVPRMTSCFECSMETFAPETTFALCTIAQTPRKPEHCIAYAFMILWESLKPFDGAKLDKDSPDHMTWVFERALERATEHNIEGVTYNSTMGVVKNIIPAIASTNALISGACVGEALKLMSFCSQSLDNYLMYVGGEGTNVESFDYNRKKDCLVCGQAEIRVSFKATTVFEKFVDWLKVTPKLQAKDPSLTCTLESGKKITLLMSSGPLKNNAECGVEGTNLAKTLSELGMGTGVSVSVTDQSFPDIMPAVSVELEIEE